MYIELDLSVVPPTAVLREADDFTAFKVVASRHDDVVVPIDALPALAGERASDPGWQTNLDSMLAYAESKGWLDGDGAIRAHVEWQ